MTHVLGEDDKKEETKLSNRNYTKYSNIKPNDNIEPNVVDVPSYVNNDNIVVENDKTVTESPVKETVETVTLATTVKGVVVNCSKLNVRVKPASDADVLCVLARNTEVEVDVARSTSDWFKIYTASGAEGFCMRNYIDAEL